MRILEDETMMDVLEASKKLIDKVYEQMSMVESCESIAGMVSDLPFVFLDTSEGDHVISLSRVLTEGQIDNIRSIIVTAIRSNAEDAAQWLSNLQEPTEQTTKYADGSEEPADEEAEEVIEEEEEPEAKPSEKPEPGNVTPAEESKKSASSFRSTPIAEAEPKKEVDGGYILERMSAGRKQKDIAAELGISQPAASLAVSRYRQEILAKLDIGKVHALHQAGWDDAAIADEFGAPEKIIKGVLRR